MTIYFDKTRQRWRYNFLMRGKRYSGYCDDTKTGVPATGKNIARAVETKIKASILENRPTHAVLPTSITMAQAVAAYVAQVKDGRSWNNQRLYARELLSYFGEDTSVCEITETRVWEYIAWARKQKLKIWVGGNIKPEQSKLNKRNENDFWRETKKWRSDSTINRYLDALRKTLNIISKQRDPLTGQPMLMAPPKIPKLREPDALPRPISSSDLMAILEKAPEHLADTVRLCIFMGFRQREALALTIDHVDLENRGVWLRGEETKGKRGEFIPANKDAVELLSRLAAQAKDRKIKYLISYRQGKKGDKWHPIKSLGSSWCRVLKECGLQGRHKFHSTKATFVTAVAMKAPAPVAQQLARHRDFETTRRYIRIADELTRQAVDALDFGINSKKTVKSNTQDSHTKINVLLPYMDKPLNILVGMAGFEPTTPSPPD